MPPLRGRRGNWSTDSEFTISPEPSVNRSTEDQLTDNENLRNQPAITRANESQEQRNKRRRA
jgi:hypothetical protein